MPSTNDLDLLRKFTRDQSQDAFTALVQRHLNLVYCAALRQVRSRQLAEEVAQSVFSDLARNAARLKPETILTAWLYQVTRRAAIDVVRSEARRQLREQIASEMNAMNANAADWTQIEPILDDAMHALDDIDRTAVLLRYFENKSLREVGETLGTTDDTARKRVNRAIEHLREFFAKRGVTVGVSGLVVVISANAVQAAPIGLVVTISTAAALAGTSILTTATASVGKAIAMTTLQKTLIAVTFTAAVGTGIYEAHQVSRLRGQVQTLQQQHAPLAEQIQQLTRENDEAAGRLAATTAELAQARRDNVELLQLRNQVVQLRQQVGLPKAGQANVTPGISAQAVAAQAAAVDAGRELGTSVVRGDPGALEKLTELSKAQHKSFNTNKVGLDDTRRGELATGTFAPIQAAFDVIGEAASQGNQVALDAVVRAIGIPELRGLAVQVVGKVAGNGSEGALELLLNPQNYGFPLASSVGALRPAADNGNQRAIDALAAVTRDADHRPLWYMAAEGLGKAAESGNAVAIDALIGLSSSTNPSVRNSIVLGLKRAAANQNSKAAEALRLMGVQ